MINLYNSVSLVVISLLLLISLLSNNLLIFWTLIEVSSFFLIYIYLSSLDNSNVSFSSFIFYLSNGLSSIFIIFGCFFNDNELLNYGVMCKFFIFPFSVLLLYVFENSNWVIIFIIGSLFKGFTLCLTYLFNEINNNVTFLCSCLTILMISLILLFFNLNLKGVWFVLNISSSVILYLSCVFLSNNVIWILYCVYLIISCFNIYCLSSLSYINNNININNSSNALNYLFSMVGFPVSINFFYKLLSMYLCLNLGSIMFVVIWCAYICLETGFLLLYFSQLISNNNLAY